jgi:HAE1 family hydrophobic/amphiphilic exporter-1
VQFAVAGPDLDRLQEYSGELLARLKALPFVVDADTSLNFGKPELRIEIDRLRAADLGVRAGDIAQALNTLIAGELVSTFNADSDQYDVRLRADSEFRASSEGLKRMTVPSSKVERGWVSLSEVTRITEEKGPSAIERLNRRRQVTISSNILPGGSQGAVINEMAAITSEMELSPQYSVILAGMSRELGRAGYYFLLAVSLSFITRLRFCSRSPWPYRSASCRCCWRDKRSTSSPGSACCSCSASSRRTPFCRSTTPTACAPRA